MRRVRQPRLPRKGVFVPRWVLVGSGLAVLVWFGLKIMVPPSREIQRLDSPDGKISARLVRTEYADDHFSILARQGRLWQRIYYGPPITNDTRTDTRERLSWSSDSRVLFFRVNGSNVWAYDFQNEQSFGPPR
jgi:hypothetical protein